MDKALQKKLDTFFSQFKQQKYRKGEILIRADENPSGVFYLTQGQVKVYGISARGDEIVLNIFKPISFFPLSWAINDTQNFYYYEATSDIVTWRAPREIVIAFIKQNPDVLYDLLSRVYRGVDGVLQRMTYLMAGTAYSRLITEILLTARRFGMNENGKSSISISEKDLAARTGLTRETVSREMAALKKKGLVTFNKKTLEVPDIEHLTNELSDLF